MLDARARAALAEAAFKVAARANAWREITIFDLADAAGEPVEAFAGATTGDALDAAEEALDRLMARGLKRVDQDALVRDRLFDILMRRFEAMEERRAAVVLMDRAFERDPSALALAHARNVRTARWALSLAGLEADGVTGAARAQGLAVILAQTRAAWRLDLGGDFAKTMAALDKALRQAEQTFGRLGGFEGKRTGRPAPAASEPVDPGLTAPPPLAG